MNSVIGQHPWVSLFAAMLTGMVAKWLLDVFFLRSEMFGLRRRLSDRERDLTDLRHEHGRSLQELKNRLTELDATAKAKAAALSSLAARDGELAGLRERERSLTEQAQAAEARVATLSSDLAALEETSARSRAQVTQLDSELVLAASREAVLIRDLACVQSVRDVLEAGVRSRDAQILGSSERIAELTEGLSSESKDLEQTRTDRAQLEQEVASTRLNLEQVQAVRDGLERELLAARSQAEAVTRGRTVAEASLKRREMELAENEQRAGEMQRALEEASREAARVGAENQRLLGEVARLSAMATTSRGNDAAAKANEMERSRLADEVKALRNDMEAQVRIRAGIEAVAKAQDAAAAELRLQLAAATAQRRALDAELEAVSASHAALEKKLAAMGGGDGRFEAALADLEELTRERNTLAAELAALRADRGGEDS